MMKTRSDHSDSLVFECDFDEPPEKVWRALTEPRLLEAWLTTDKSRPDSGGGQAAAPVPPPADSVDRTGRGVGGDVGRVGSSEYEIVRAEPHRLLRYRWRDRESGAGDSGAREVHSVVTVELAPVPTGGTHLRVTHGEFRVVAAVTPVATASIRPITSARCRRTPILSLAMQTPWRRAA